MICEAAGYWQMRTSGSVLQEIKRTEPLPGDPYHSSQPAKKVKRFSPGHHETPWLPKLTESDLKMHV